MRPTAEEIAATLGLAPHPEGGFFLETYRAAQTLRTPRGERAATTSILFLVTAGSLSRLHRLSSDELWIFQGGSPLDLVTLAPGGDAEVRVLSAVGDAGLPQALVPAGSWQGARLAGGSHLPAERAWALVACVVSPGFDFEDFEMGERQRLLADFPGHAGLIRDFT